MAPFLIDKDERVSIVQAPIFLHRALPFDRQAGSLAEVFVRTGFADARLCRPVVRAWRRLLHEVEPDVVLSDFAPSLNVAAAGVCPVLVIGNGWTIPPEGALPQFDGTSGDPAASAAGDRILEALEIASDGRWSASAFCEVLRGNANFVCTLPQLDPYSSHRTGEHYWPVEIPPPTAVSTNVRDSAIVYLPGDHPALPLVGAAAERLPWRWQAYAGGGGQASQGGLSFSKEPLDLSGILPSTRLAIHHGGLGTANWCLIHRVPQVIFPTDMEKLLIGRGIEREKSGIVYSEFVIINDFLKSVRSLADDQIASPETSAMQTASDVGTLTALLNVSRTAQGDRSGSAVSRQGTGS